MLSGKLDDWIDCTLSGTSLAFGSFCNRLLADLPSTGSEQVLSGVQKLLLEGAHLVVPTASMAVCICRPAAPCCCL
jgi:hypothetical protein